MSSEDESYAAYLGYKVVLFKESPRVSLKVLSEAWQAGDLILLVAIGQLEAEGGGHPA